RAADDVDPAAGGERDDHVERTRRPSLRLRFGGDDRKRQRGGKPAGPCHDVPSVSRPAALAHECNGRCAADLIRSSLGRRSGPVETEIAYTGDASPCAQPSRADTQNAANVPAVIAARMPAISSW